LYPDRLQGIRDRRPALGSDPWLIEASVTVYVDFPAKPCAAFATNFWDYDNDPGFNPPWFPPQTGGTGTTLPTATSSSPEGNGCRRPVTRSAAAR
jgi:hypothetical protein